MHQSEIWHSKKNDCRLSRTQVTTGIKNVSDNAANEILGIYDMNGRKVSTNAKGLKIVRYKNGNVSKQLVK